MSKTAKLSLFQGYGIELEYMIVDKRTLAIRPIADEVLTALDGQLHLEVECGDVAWSNELVLHVAELKCNGPQKNLIGLRGKFQAEIERVNRILARHDAMLLGTAMHPFMDPHTDTRIWPHENTVIYQTYNRIFDCRGHGWSNLQSTHINFPFANDQEFGRLHAAIRLVLPLIPALAASSPVVERKITGRPDNRLDFYRGNQRKVPSVAGRVIPERVFTRADYEEKILQRMYRDIAPYDPDAILQDEWLNSRGAIARFDRDAIEIRLIDIQESVTSDMAVVSAVISLVKALADERWSSLARQQAVSEEQLEKIFLACLERGDDALVGDDTYLGLFGLPQAVTGAGFWREKVRELTKADYPIADFSDDLLRINYRGTLARTITRAIGGEASPAGIERVYRRLAESLAAGTVFYG